MHVTLDRFLAELLTLSISVPPNSPEAHPAVRTWVQEALDRGNDPGRSMTSQWLTREVVKEVARPELVEAWYRVVVDT